MSSHRSNKIVIWCSYFNQDLSTSQGRRVAKTLALKSPTLRMLSGAAEDVGLSFEIEQEKGFPGRWWEKEGRIIVDTGTTKISKTQIIKKIAKQMRANLSKEPEKEKKLRKPTPTKIKKHHKPKPKPKK